MPVTTSGPDLPVPAPLVVAASLVAVEAGVLGSRAWSSSRPCAWRQRRWARGPAVMTQLICLGLAWNFWGDQTTPVSVGLALVAVIVIAGLLHPESTAVLEEDAGRGA